MSWTPESEARLIALDAEGRSQTKISEVLYKEFRMRITRSGIAGKIDRLRKAGRITRENRISRPSGEGRRRKSKPRAQPSAPGRFTKPPIRRSRPKGRALRLNGETGPRTVSHVKPKTAEVNAKAINDGQGVTLLDLEDNHCRYPINSLYPGQSDELRFCGRPQDDTISRGARRHAGQYCADHRDITTTDKAPYGQAVAHRLSGRMYHGTTKRLT